MTARLEGQAEPAPAAPPTLAVDIMAALRESLARAGRPQPKDPPAERC